LQVPPDLAFNDLNGDDNGDDNDSSFIDKEDPDGDGEADGDDDADAAAGGAEDPPPLLLQSIPSMMSLDLTTEPNGVHFPPLEASGVHLDGGSSAHPESPTNSAATVRGRLELVRQLQRAKEIQSAEVLQGGLFTM